MRPQYSSLLALIIPKRQQNYLTSISHWDMEENRSQFKEENPTFTGHVQSSYISVTRDALFGNLGQLVQRLSQSERKWMIRKWRNAKHKHESHWLDSETTWPKLHILLFSLPTPRFEYIDIKVTFLSFTAPTLTNISLFGLGSLVMLQNQLHPPFFSLYCFFWILIVLFDRYGRVNIWQNWNSSIIEK